MKKQTKIIIAVLLFVAVSFAIWYLYLRNILVVSPQAGNTTNIPNTGGSLSTNSVSIFPLKQGSTGKEVAELQKALNKLLPLVYSKIAEDGVFGGQTQGAINNTMGLGYYPLSELQYKIILNKALSNQSIYQY